MRRGSPFFFPEMGRVMSRVTVKAEVRVGMEVRSGFSKIGKRVGLMVMEFASGTRVRLMVTEFAWLD